jgi:tRNA(Ile)-lysidine synthase
MSELVDQVRRDGLLAPGAPVVVLYSGGRDSTCLLDVAVRIAGRSAVTALHVNYGLRDSAADDERHCLELCQAREVPLRLSHPQRPHSGNIQAWAREERYSAAALLAGELGADIAAGHTATDQVETILYRLASSPSRRALLGMVPRDGRLIRPLLAFTRGETGAYCLEHDLPWREDESNESDAYARARIRHRLLPILREVHPAAEENVLALSAVLRDEAEVLDALVADALEGEDRIELAALRELPAALRRLVVQHLADGAIGGPAPGVGRRAEDVAALRANAALDLPSGVRAVVERGVLRFERQGAGAPPAAGSVSGPRHRIKR